jgi:hypothetical protein
MPGTINPIGIGTAPLYPKQATAGAPLDPLILPGDTNPPILFEPPPGLTAGATEVWIIATGGANWGGCQVWLSLDGTTYAYAGTIYRGGRQGILTAALPSHADPDASSTLSSICHKARASSSPAPWPMPMPLSPCPNATANCSPLRQRPSPARVTTI